MWRSPLLLTALLLASCKQGGLQPRSHYEAALANTSRSPSLVRIGLVRNGKTEITCVFAHRLLWAITTENGMPTGPLTKQAFDLAKANTRHVFSFNKLEAIRELGLDANTKQRQQACTIIARGKPALLADYTGEITEAMPMGSDE